MLCLCYFQSNQSKLQEDHSEISQSINVKWRTCDRNGKQFFQ